MHPHPPRHPQPRPETPGYDPRTGQPLYPYAPDAYEELHLVGHRLENGVCLPVKVFVRDNLGFGDARLRLHIRIWRQWALIAGLAGLAVGLWIGS